MIPFTKMQGIGNDFVMLDAIQSSELPDDLPALARTMNDRRFGIGGDGLILLEKGDEVAPFTMRMFNPDGSESEMCGNGIRCFAVLLRDHGHLSGDSVDVHTGAGVLHLDLVGDSVRVDMGPARLTRGEIGMTGATDEQFLEQPIHGSFKGTAVSMGNPHVVIFVDDVASIDLELLGPKIEKHELFPKRVNVHFAQVVDRNTIIQRTWERGAGITLACGTGACSVGVAGYLTGRTERLTEVRLPGGNLQIEYQESGRVLMTGPAKTVFVGNWP